jgi:hypothetical protein
LQDFIFHSIHPYHIYMRDAEIYDCKFLILSGLQIAQFLHGGILHKKARSETERAFDHSDSIRNF